jgi:hypothetical protein
METNVTVPHFAFQLRAGYEGSDGIDDENVNGAGANESIGDFQRLLAGVGLADEEVVHIDSELAGIDRVKSMLGVDESTGAAAPLGFGDSMESESGFAGAFRSVDFNNAAAREATDAEGKIEAE